MYPLNICWKFDAHMMRLTANLIIASYLSPLYRLCKLSQVIIVFRNSSTRVVIFLNILFILDIKRYALWHTFTHTQTYTVWGCIKLHFLCIMKIKYTRVLCKWNISLIFYYSFYLYFCIRIFIASSLKS